MPMNCRIATTVRAAALALSASVFAPAVAAEPRPLPSWNEGPARSAIVDFVARVTRQGGPDFVAPPERIAAFDNDGTLWCEQPMYVQAVFAFDRARGMAEQVPALKGKPAFRAILSNDREAMARFGEREIAELVAATHTGISPDAFRGLAREWLARAEHPRFRRRYAECLYLPQLELLAYLRAHGFRIFIVTGGGIDFVRAFTEGAYDVPIEHVVGSSTKTRFEARDDRGDLIKLPDLGSIDDGPGKPVNINLHIGRRPILAFGNSDGDLEMLEYTAAGPGPRLMLLVHHDDAAREYAYDRTSPVGRLDKALAAAARQRWSVVSMKDDWKAIFPPAEPGGGAR
jgi:phosphoglycolate phosphatase-like HAD superfamily hydrolase